jgi:phosphoglycerate kinase
MTTLAGIRTLADLDLAKKRVFIRVDFNVPMKKGTTEITDDTRIREALPTIRAVMEAGARVILASHLGRPKPGKHDGLSLEPAGARLSHLLGVEVHLPDDCIGDSPKKVIHDLRDGQVCLLENLRFHEEEEKDDAEFAKALMELCDVYVDDAFGACHRAHASVHALPRMMRERGAGFLLEKEIRVLGKLVTSPDKPYVAILGGAKVSDKIKVIDQLLGKVDVLLIGGAMAYTFMAAKGEKVGGSRVEKDKLDIALRILEKAKKLGVQLLLPTDHVVAAEPKGGIPTLIQRVIGDGMVGLDIGPETIAAYKARVISSKTVFWNGPMGMFETPEYAAGTRAVAEALVEATKAGSITVVGGGDSAAAIAEFGMADKVTHVSTGGGASLEFLEGRVLPGVAILEE